MNHTKYFYLLILGLISPFKAYNRSFILNKITIELEILISLIITLAIYLCFNIYNINNLNFNKLDKTTFLYLIINSLLLSLKIFIAGKLLSQENVFKIKSIEIPFKLIILTLVSYSFYNQKINLKIIVGNLLLICGIFLLDKSIK